jgi:hypothetical protein
VNRRGMVYTLVLFFLLGVPAFAYADPSGGTLFQILMPALAAIWATWMIFANRVRRLLRGFLRKLRGSDGNEPAV